MSMIHSMIPKVGSSECIFDCFFLCSKYKSSWLMLPLLCYLDQMTLMKDRSPPLDMGRLPKEDTAALSHTASPSNRAALLADYARRGQYPALGLSPPVLPMPPPKAHRRPRIMPSPTARKRLSPPRMGGEEATAISDPASHPKFKSLSLLLYHIP
jgi:hypothetical protein